MKLYPKNAEPFSDALFQDPGSEYRGAPFWAWNHHLDKDTIRREIGYFKDMGMGGYHAHVRTGLDTPYLGEEFMDMMQTALDEAKKQGLLHWLYDEDRWPSGAAGGLVTKNADLAQKRLLFTAFPVEDAVPFVEGMHLHHETYYELGRYQVSLEAGELVGYAKVENGELADWYAYLHLAPRSPWYNNESYADTLKGEAIRQFVRITHDTYAAHFQDDFGAAVPAIFTDEPQFAKKETLARCEEKQTVAIPFTDDLEATYQQAYGESLLAHLPELFWEWKDGHVSVTRYRYHDHVCERFAGAFADIIGRWCREHGLLLTGHMMEEPTLQSQTAMLGEAMRSYRGFGLPGIDMLCDRREYTTAKQAQSASHQLGCPGVLSELYGVTNWDFDFRGHKLQGDWQAALGVTTRVHHLTWMSMEGEAKRDYPACIGFQSPWYQEYKQVEDHFARVNTALTRGQAHVRIGVLHPIESYWLYYGSNEKTGAAREEMDAHFQDLNRWLLLDLLDFDYLSEALLREFPAQLAEPVFRAGRMGYEVILVPAMKTIRSTTLDRLEAFHAAGGTILFVGEIPSLVDAVPSDRAKRLAQTCGQVRFERTQVLRALEPWREVEAITLSGYGAKSAGTHTDRLLYQMRQDGAERWLFLVHGEKMPDPDQPREETIEVRIRGSWKPVLYDTVQGRICPLQPAYTNDRTILRFAVYEHDSLLIRLLPGEIQQAAEVKTVRLHPEEPNAVPVRIPAIVPVTLEEKNVLLLDMAAYRLDDGPWQPEEEILRLDNEVRKVLGMPSRKKEVAQPWTIEAEETLEHTVALRFTIRTRIPLQGTRLGLENREAATILVDDHMLDAPADGWYVDPCIDTIELPTLEAGEHRIEIRVPFGVKTNLEDLYLLGDFSVQVQGTICTLDAPARELAFGDLVPQGLPFYGGNLTYHIPVPVETAGILSVRATQFRAPLWKAWIDDGDPVPAPYAPYRISLPVEAGDHTLHLQVFGSRINTFGQVHNCDETMDWFGPDSWRTEGPAWSYEYHLHRTGILKHPEIAVCPNTGEELSDEENKEKEGEKAR